MKLSTLAAALAVVAVIATVAPTPAAASTEGDPALFLQRLESIGLKTDYVRRVIGKIEIFYRKPSSTAEAQWGYILDNLYIPWDQKEDGSNRIKFDLESHQINTLVHELTHASNDGCASESAAPGTPERQHFDVVNAIWADLFDDPRHTTLGLARYPRMKADEIVAYYIGTAVMNVFDGVREIVLFNEHFADDVVGSADDAADLGDRLVLPPAAAQAATPWLQTMANRRYDGHRAGNDRAYFENKEIPWNERDWVKRDMYEFGMGLGLPRTAAELVDLLNRTNSPWMNDVRARVRAARAKQVVKLQAAAAAQTPAGADEPTMEGLNLLGAATVRGD